MSAVHLPGRKGWVPSSILKKKVDELSSLVSRRSLSVGDIMMACKDEEEAGSRKAAHSRAPVPLPRKDRKDVHQKPRKLSLEMLDGSSDNSGPSSLEGPSGSSPPLPVEPVSALERTQSLISPGETTLMLAYACSLFLFFIEVS